MQSTRVASSIALKCSGLGLDASTVADAALPSNRFTHVTQFVTLAHSGHAARRPRYESVIAWQDAFGRVVSAEAGLGGEDGGHRFVAFLTSPSMACMESMLGCLGAGCVLVPLNVRWSLDEMVEELSGLGVLAVVVDDGFAAEGRALCARLGRLTERTARLVAVDPSGCQTLVPSSAAGLSCGQWALRKAPSDVAVVVFTSGTSSPKPKAAMLTHDNIIFQCGQKERVCGYHGGDVYLHVAPWFHVGGLVSALSMVMVGAEHVFMERSGYESRGAGFDANEVLDVLEREGCTSFIAVPTMVRDLARQCEARGGRALLSVERVLVGAGGLGREDVRRARRMMPGAVLMTAYGMTEACSSISYSRVPDGDCDEDIENGEGGNAAYVGEVPPSIRVGVLGARGAILSNGRGELVTNGRHVFKAYFRPRLLSLAPGAPPSQQPSPMRQPEREQHFVVDPRDGTVWFRTGDVGIVRDKKIWLCGRIKDMIKTGGENVHAAEVERVLAALRGVEECSVFPVPDERWGEAVAAVIVVNDTWDHLLRGKDCVLATAAERRAAAVYDHLKGHCREQGLASFKVPKAMVVMDGRVHTLPKNATGKVLKRELQGTTVALLSRERERRLREPPANRHTQNESGSSVPGGHRSKL